MSDYVIVGSGIGGLAAAKVLIQAGKNVIVLEASNYIGGRLYTQTVPAARREYAFDHGASFIVGEEQNPMMELSKSVPNVDLMSLKSNYQIRNWKGEEIQEKADAEWEAYADLRDNQIPQAAAEDQSVQSTLRRLNGGKLNNPIFMFQAAADLELDMGASISLLSGKRGHGRWKYEGQSYYVVSGFQQFAQQLVNQHKIQVLLNHKVTELNYNGGSTTVVCENGKQFRAQCVMINVPLGVLKKKSIKFTPKLPEAKLTAIDRIGFGNLCKVMIVFTKFMPTITNYHYFGVVADKISDRGLFTYFFNANPHTGMPCLVSFAMGASADAAQTMPEEVLKVLLAKRLSLYTKNEVLPKDFTIYRTNWRGKSNFMGSIAYNHVNTKEEDWQEMAKPVFETGWHFCGEHTTKHLRGTAHGAYLSGEYAAQHIVDETAEADWTYFDCEEQEGEEEDGEGQQQEDEGQAEEEAEEPKKEQKEVKKEQVVKKQENRKSVVVKIQRKQPLPNKQEELPKPVQQQEVPKPNKQEAQKEKPLNDQQAAEFKITKQSVAPPAPIPKKRQNNPNPKPTPPPNPRPPKPLQQEVEKPQPMPPIQKISLNTTELPLVPPPTNQPEEPRIAPRQEASPSPPQPAPKPKPSEQDLETMEALNMLKKKKITRQDLVGDDKCCSTM